MPTDLLSRPVLQGLREETGLPPAPSWIGADGPRLAHVGFGGRPPAAEGISVVIPAWRSEATLAACAAGIARAATALRGACEVELIVVDDGSSTPVADVLAAAPRAIEIRVLSIPHSGQSQATNTGALAASGELLVLCDSDMVLNPWTLDQLLRAVANDPEALCFGFREDADPADPRFSPAAILAGALDRDPLLIGNDNRLRFDVPGYPSNLFAATRLLRDLTGGRLVLPPGRMSYSLPNMAFGCLLACRRQAFLDLGGFDGRFVDWGYGDTELAARWIAGGRTLLPVFTANGLHARHRPRDPRQWRLAGGSRRRYDEVLAGEWQRPAPVAAVPRDDRLLRPTTPAAAVAPAPELTGAAVAAKAAVAGDLALFEEAGGGTAVELAADPATEAAALRALRLSGAPGYLGQIDRLGAAPGEPAAALERGLLGLAAGELDGARRQLERAATAEDWLLRGCARYLGARRATHHWSAAQRLLEQKMPRAAASRLLCCLASADGAPLRAGCEELLEGIDAADRRLF